MLYDIGFFIFSLLYLPVLIFKGKMHGDFKERFGIYNEEKLEALASGGDVIWIQAVSVGEVVACKEFVAALRREFPSKRVVISTITKTGNDLAKKLFSQFATIIYFPLDFSFTSRRVVSLIRPELFIMVETEIWPNLIGELSRNNIPLIMINGRISDKSFGKYKLVSWYLKNVLNKIEFLCMQSELDGERIKEMGAPSDRVRITGNMKFDVDTARKAGDVKGELGLKPEEVLLVAGSTHEGEEEIVLEAFKELVNEFSSARLLIAPRHVDRADEVDAVVKRFGFESVRLSKSPGHQFMVRQAHHPSNHPERSRGTKPPVIVLDTIGRLADIYAIATAVFIGGSLVRHGGQNPIEAAVFERPIVFGPHMFNFKDIAALFLKKKAAIQVDDGRDLFRSLKILLADGEKRIAMGRRAKNVVLENKGAISKNIKAIKELVR